MKTLQPDAAGERLRDHNHLLSMALVASTAGLALWLWTRGEVGVARAAATAMALRLNGISHWIMWELAAVRERGTVQDGIRTLSRRHAVVDAPGRRAGVRAARSASSTCSSTTAASGASSRTSRCTSARARRSPRGPLRRRQEHDREPAAAVLRRRGGRILIDGQDISGVRQDSLRSQIGMSRRTPRCCTARCATTSSTAVGRHRRRDDRRARRGGARVHRGLADARADAPTTPTWASAA